MNIRDHSSKFTIFVYTGDVNIGASVKVALSKAGYDAYFFQELNSMMDRVRELTPHIVVYSTSTLPGALSNFVRNVLTLNDEIKFIAISAISQFDILAQYNDLGHVDVISDAEVALENRVVWSVDRACEKLFLTYQNEHLFDRSKELETRLKAAPSLQISQESSGALRGNSSISISVRVSEYMSASSKEEILQKFMASLTDFRSIYFKYLPSVKSFVATHSHGFNAEEIQGVGVQLTDAEMRDLGSQISVGLLPPSFTNMLVEAFQFNPPRGWPLFVQNSLEGIVVYSGDANPQSMQPASEEFSLLRLIYSHFALEKRIDALEVLDPATEVLNRPTYLKVLKEEMDRARRLRHPLSVVKISMDDFFEIEQSRGEHVRDALLKALADLISKTSRTNDKTARTGMNEFAMILPHCTKKGAALRAERLRRIVESSSLLDGGGKISISLGVSEFPTLCMSAESLDESSTKALLHIADKGGNKICLFKAPDNHQPEFEVTIE